MRDRVKRTPAVIETAAVIRLRGMIAAWTHVVQTGETPRIRGLARNALLGLQALRADVEALAKCARERNTCRRTTDRS